jgi:uncharacterized protein (UPF0333 family)
MMKIKNRPLNERGIAHLGLILLLVVIVGAAGYFAFTRVNSANDTKDNTSTASSTSEDAKDSAAINDADKAAQKVPTTNTQEAPNVAQ